MFTLATSFYARMRSDLDAAEILAMHDGELDQAAEKLALFLMVWLGGPARYQVRFGHPRLRADHARFAIGPDQRDAWLRCMGHVLHQHVADEQLRDELGSAFAAVAEHIRNRES